MTEESIIIRADDLSISTVDGKPVIFDTSTGSKYILNEIGLRILDFTYRATSVDTILQKITDEYHIDPEQFRRQLVAFLEEMEDYQLIQVVHDRVATHEVEWVLD